MNAHLLFGKTKKYIFLIKKLNLNLLKQKTKKMKKFTKTFIAHLLLFPIIGQLLLSTFPILDVFLIKLLLLVGYVGGLIFIFYLIEIPQTFGLDKVKEPNICNKYSISLVLILLLLNFGQKVTKFYNVTNVIEHNYTQKSQEIDIFIKNLYFKYKDKKSIAKLNQKDFSSLVKEYLKSKETYKGVLFYTENVNIPYNVQSELYKDLSEFIELERDKIVSIEKSRQIIANDYNILITSFPNIIYSTLLRKKSIDYTPYKERIEF